MDVQIQLLIERQTEALETIADELKKIRKLKTQARTGYMYDTKGAIVPLDERGPSDPIDERGPSDLVDETRPVEWGTGDRSLSRV